MSDLKFSQKGQDLIKLYERMATEGYDRTDDTHVGNAFSDFELRAYKSAIADVLKKYSVDSVLDYGSGGSDWQVNGFDEDTNKSAIEYFCLADAYRYEPARDIDERKPVDCVVCFDVLEHIFISDVTLVLRDIFSWASKLVVINVACYPAAAKLPNGENAHITVRNPGWWKGMVDSVSVEFPDVSVLLLCSTQWRNSSAFPIWNANMWQESSSFVIEN